MNIEGNIPNRSASNYEITEPLEITVAEFKNNSIATPVSSSMKGDKFREAVKKPTTVAKQALSSHSYGQAEHKIDVSSKEPKQWMEFGQDTELSPIVGREKQTTQTTESKSGVRTYRPVTYAPLSFLRFPAYIIAYDASGLNDAVIDKGPVNPWNIRVNVIKQNIMISSKFGYFKGQLKPGANFIKGDSEKQTIIIENEIFGVAEF